MNKKLPIIIAGFIFANTGWAQLSQGGLPLGFSSENVSAQTVHYFTLPELKNTEKKNEHSFNVPYLIATGINADIHYPESGSFHYLQDGRKIWSTKIKVAGAKAIGLYYDQFYLPAGVHYYLSNKNRKHILGAYTATNNNASGCFANEALQGEEATLELDIPADALTEKIKLHVNSIAAYHSSVDYLSKYLDIKARPTEEDPWGLEGSSSTCEINAICPEGAHYPIQRKATLQTLIPVRNSEGVLVGLRSCSATMVNNTGNTISDCRQYVLLATHCDGANSMEDAHFSDWLFRFNFEKLNCNGGPAAEVNTLTGASFKARANYIETETPAINGDFLLLELKDTIPLAWDVYLSGWNRNTSMSLTANLPEKLTGFHHPAADIKKLLTIQTISPFGEAGGSLGPGTHWQLFPINEGGAEQGSSGSGLFDQNGRLIGIASVAGNAVNTCNISGKGEAVNFFKYIAYSKLSLAWDYSLDGEGSNRKLKPWLDPLNSGAMTIDPLKSNCASLPTEISETDPGGLDNFIDIYPNPSRDGIITTYIHTDIPKDIQVTLYDITGREMKKYAIEQAYKIPFTIDLSSYANGSYILRFTSNDAVGTKKVILAK